VHANSGSYGAGGGAADDGAASAADKLETRGGSRAGRQQVLLRCGAGRREGRKRGAAVAAVVAALR
jgi:hypothetical protein